MSNLKHRLSASESYCHILHTTSVQHVTLHYPLYYLLVALYLQHACSQAKRLPCSCKIYLCYHRQPQPYSLPSHRPAHRPVLRTYTVSASSLPGMSRHSTQNTWQLSIPYHKTAIVLCLNRDLSTRGMSSYCGLPPNCSLLNRGMFSAWLIIILQKK